MKKPSKIGKVRVSIYKNIIKTSCFLLKSEINPKNFKKCEINKIKIKNDLMKKREKNE